MKENELQKTLIEIRNGMKLFDQTVFIPDYETGEGRLNKRQTVVVKKLFDLFRELNWQLAFNNYKELVYGGKKVIDDRECGTPVKIRPCGNEYENKTYFGVLIGDVALTIGHSIKGGIVTANPTQHNPAIFVPELGKIIYGIESWWKRIKDEKELEEIITDKAIENVWYVKLLKKIN